MSYYGGKNKVLLTRDVLSYIINLLPEEYWYKLKLNTKIVKLIEKLHKVLPIRQLAKLGCIESLNGNKVGIRHICQAGSLNLLVRYVKNEKFDLNWALYGACKVGNRDMIDYITTRAIVTGILVYGVRVEEARMGSLIESMKSRG